MQKDKGEFIEDVISDVKEKGKALFEEGLDKASQLSDQTVTEVLEDMKYYIRKNPWKSVGVAAGIGLLIGALFKSNKSE